MLVAPAPSGQNRGNEASVLMRTIGGHAEHRRANRAHRIPGEEWETICSDRVERQRQRRPGQDICFRVAVKSSDRQSAMLFRAATVRERMLRGMRAEKAEFIKESNE